MRNSFRRTETGIYFFQVPLDELVIYFTDAGIFSFYRTAVHSLHIWNTHCRFFWILCRPSTVHRDFFLSQSLSSDKPPLDISPHFVRTRRYNVYGILEKETIIRNMPAININHQEIKIAMFPTRHNNGILALWSEMWTVIPGRNNHFDFK